MILILRPSSFLNCITSRKPRFLFIFTGLLLNTLSRSSPLRLRSSETYKWLVRNDKVFLRYASNFDKTRYIAEMIPEQTQVPCSYKDENLCTAFNNQTSVHVEITEGKIAKEGKTKPEDVDVIGEVILNDLPSGRPAGTPLTLIYDYNKNNLVNVKVIDVETGKEKQVEVELKLRALQNRL